MQNLFWGGIVLLAVLAGCGANESPTRPNDFTPLTSIEIVAASPVFPRLTSTPLQAIGNFSGLFTRDITAQVVWVSNTPTVADFNIPASPGRVTGIARGTATVTATVGAVAASRDLTVTDATVTSPLTITPDAPSTPKGLTRQFAVSGTFSDGITRDLTFDASWASSDLTVATISNAVGSKGLAQAHAIGTTTITATFDVASGTAQLTVTDPVLQSIVVTPANPSLLTLSTASFTATGLYSDGSTADITNKVNWTSDSPTIATIATGGTASTLKQGTTSIGATLDGVSVATTLKVTGGDLTSIALTPANPTLVKGTIRRVTATGTFSNGTSRDITGKVTWLVADTNIATVDTSGGGNLALVNAKTATLALAPIKLSASFSTVTGETNLTVTAPTLKSNGLTITPLSQNLTVGTSGRFTVTGAFSDGTTQDLTITADWTSSDVATAAVDNTNVAKKGRVTGIAENTAPVTITATYGGQTISAAVTVTQRTLKAQPLGLAISPPFANFSSGTQLQFTATASYTDGKTQDVTEDVVWIIDKSNVAILADSTNQPGVVVAVDSGTATLTASFDTQTQTVNLAVP